MNSRRDLDSEIDATHAEASLSENPYGRRRTIAAFWIGAAASVVWSAPWLVDWVGAGLTFGELTTGARFYHIDSIVRLLGILLCSTAAALAGGAVAAFAVHALLHWFLPGPFNRSK